MLMQLFVTTAVAQRPVKDAHTVYFADPCIFHLNGVYYLYGTTDENANSGFIVYTSTDLINWKRSAAQEGYALKKGEAFGQSGFWAPHIFQQRDTFYMAYVADEQIAIAKATSPAGPFTQKTIKQLDAPVKQIDPFVFTDDDGKKYLYHVRLTNGNRIFVAEMEDDLSAIKPATVKECINATEQWENTANAPWPVTEGPTVLKHNGLYYMFYTANDFRNPDYAVGFATATSPYGPWKKYNGGPLISRSLLGINGTGHGDFFTDAQNNLLYVFHTHFSDSSTGPRKTAIIKFSFVKDEQLGIDKPVADKESFYFLKK
ncbi:beta-xylosidase [Lacibacter luteus]|uniref:Beta-xylosidase n=2 Tax=Lacibacter luteus TaxID=2508719 RepID=A0A4Q1CP51_9BACT|nr:beta-xylosidase [Lacibacter luteus]